MLKLCLTVILLGCLTQINGENLPVFIWGQKTPSFLPALSQLNGDEFVTLVKSQSDKETLTVVFVENHLSVEDFSQCKLKTETCFENLRKIEQKTYLTAVEDPIKALEASFSANAQKSVSLNDDGELSEKIDASGSEKLLFVYLDDNENFAKHDELMNKLYSTIAQERENVIAIYTARHPSFVYSKPLVRKTREAAEPAAEKKEAKSAEKESKPEDTNAAEPKQDEVQTEQKVFITSPAHFMIAFRSISVQIGNEPAQNVDLATVTVAMNATTNDQELMSAEVIGGTHRIGINMELSGGTWRAKTFSYNGNQKLRSAVPISAYDRKSFGCGDLLIADVVEKIHITFVDVQIQPLFKPAVDEVLTQFSSHHNDCVGFFSPAIWGALFVVILLMSILSCGLTFILDIKTNDRFDDPKGKTITINAQD